MAFRGQRFCNVSVYSRRRLGHYGWTLVWYGRPQLLFVVLRCDTSPAIPRQLLLEFVGRLTQNRDSVLRIAALAFQLRPVCYNNWLFNVARFGNGGDPYPSR